MARRRRGSNLKIRPFIALCSALLAPAAVVAAPVTASVLDTDNQVITLQPGHPSLQKWRLPDSPPAPEDNVPNAARVSLGKALFFDPRLSGDGNMSCASCHSPLRGWSDGLPTGRGSKSLVLDRASPTVINTAYNSIQMWDGRKKSLEDQAMGPMEASVEMNADIQKLFTWLNGHTGYRTLFEKAYPGQPIDAGTLSKAIASFERTVVSNDSPFDRWVKGRADAMTPDQVKGFALFIDPKKGNCSACHSGPNFTDNGFHNLGLASYAREKPDMGRFAHKPLPSLRGAFKTPTVREAANTAPYFHDGSAATLRDVVKHYVGGGSVKTDLSPNMRPLDLSEKEIDQLVSFMQAVSTPPRPFELPVLPD